MLWLVKQSTLTWLLLTFMFPRTLFKLQSAMSSPDFTSPAQPSPGQPGQFSDSGEIRNFAKCLHIVPALCSLLGPPSGTATCWRGEILLNRDPAANKILQKYKNAFLYLLDKIFEFNIKTDYWSQETRHTDSILEANYTQ